MSGLPGTHSCLHMILSLLTSFTSLSSLYPSGCHMLPRTCSLYTHSTCWEHPHFISPTVSVELEHCYGKSDNWVEWLLCTFLTPSLCLLYISPQPFLLTFILILHLTSLFGPRYFLFFLQPPNRCMQTIQVKDLEPVPFWDTCRLYIVTLLI